jgi:uncharacterized membrane protein YhaH (DUF805 family)
MKKIKAFFGPIQSGRYKGRVFWNWYLSYSRLGISVLFLSAGILTRIIPEYFTDEVFWQWFLSVFFFGVFLLITFKTLQHWSDLINGRSR